MTNITTLVRKHIWPVHLRFMPTYVSHGILDAVNKGFKQMNDQTNITRQHMSEITSSNEAIIEALKVDNDKADNVVNNSS